MTFEPSPAMKPRKAPKSWWKENGHLLITVLLIFACVGETAGLVYLNFVLKDKDRAISELNMVSEVLQERIIANAEELAMKNIRLEDQEVRMSTLYETLDMFETRERRKQMGLSVEDF